MEKTASRREFVKVMRWLAEHPAEKSFLIDTMGPYDPEDYLQVIEKLEADSLEYLIPLILQSYPMNREFNLALDRMAADALIQQWEDMGADGFLQRIKGLTEEEIRIRRQKEEKEKGASAPV